MIPRRFFRQFEITSPSRVWRNTWDKPEIPELRPVEKPWYSARDKREPYEYPELKHAARRVRRLIRRYWYGLFFEPNRPIALSIRAAMSRPPTRKPEKAAIYREVNKLLEANAIKIDPKFTDDLLKELGITE